MARRTAHDCPDAGDEVYDLGVDAGVGAGAERRVVGGGGEVDWRGLGGPMVSAAVGFVVVPCGGAADKL